MWGIGMLCRITVCVYALKSSWRTTFGVDVSDNG
jgi:hypothetical protein